MYNRLIIIFGVSGSGKTTVGSELSRRISATFVDADDFHSPENKQKMINRIPLQDEDRFPWLSAIITHLKALQGTVVLACSCLKKKYRELFKGAIFVYLKVDRETLLHRLENRSHFFKKEMLDSQLQDLEEPHSENVILFNEMDDLVAQLNSIQ